MKSRSKKGGSFKEFMVLLPWFISLPLSAIIISGGGSEYWYIPLFFVGCDVVIQLGCQL